MTTAESRALYRLASFLLGPCEQERRHLYSHDGAQEVSQKEALEALEFLYSRKAEVGGVYSHGTAELRDKWNARFGQPEGATQITAEERLKKEGRLKKRDTAWQAFDACLELSFAQARTDKVGK